MDASLAQRAIDCALSGDWQEAIAANLKILKENQNDVDALNRLARAYQEVGQIGKARAGAQKVLKINPTNQIAQKALARLKTLKKVDGANHTKYLPESFLEIPGKTKLIGLIHPGDSLVLASLNAGDEVSFLTHPHRVSVVTQDGKYIGRLPDDLAARIRNSIKGGVKFQVLIKSIDTKNVKVFIKSSEISFPAEKIDYVSFTPPELVHKETPEIPMSEENI